MKQQNEKNKQFYVELVFALLVTGLVSCCAFSNLFFAPNDVFPLTSDAMGHMAKVRYLAECLTQGEFPSWFPSWYNGTAVTQYYPPFSYWIMAGIFAFVKNAMLTYKINYFVHLFIGGIGVWYFCRKYIGRWCGLFGIVAYVFQPGVLFSLFRAGQIAEGPITSLTPWYVLLILAFCKKPNAKLFLGCTVVCSLMILSHPNTTFMICLCVIAILGLFVAMKRVPGGVFCFFSLSIVLSGMLTAFWSLVGVTGLENPGIPYLLPEAAMNYTATLQWYTDMDSTFFIFGLPITILSMVAVLLFALRRSRKLVPEKEFFCMMFLISLNFLTIMFSFGMRIPFFEYLPMAESFVPGRILQLTSITGAMLAAYVVWTLWEYGRKKKGIAIKFVTVLTYLSVIAVTIYFMNPIDANYPIKVIDEFDAVAQKADLQGMPFEKGRYAMLGTVDCFETYFPMLYGFNSSDGWNIEGTPHNQTLWNHIVASSSEDNQYIARNLAYWNVRLLLLADMHQDVKEELNKEYSFEHIHDGVSNRYYVSKDPSSYFFREDRNSLVVGKGGAGIAVKYPWLVYDRREDIYTFSLDELKSYKFIYLCEPQIDSLEEKKKIENMVENIVNAGIQVIVEPTHNRGYSLFDVVPADIPEEDDPEVLLTENSPITKQFPAQGLEDNGKYLKVLLGLDKSYYQLLQNDGRLVNDIIGTKKVGDGEVLFIGMHLSRFLKPVYIKNWGHAPDEKFPAICEPVEAFFEELLLSYGVETDFWPNPFPVKTPEWNYKGVTFDYSAKVAGPVTVSLTYAPRWRATLDGKPLLVDQRESLIRLNLPAGNHKVTLTYGITKYGAIGYICSVLALFAFILLIRYYDVVYSRFLVLYERARGFLQL